MAEYSVGTATRNKIYQAAMSLFYEHGIQATSYNQIAERAQVNVGLITYHFKKKSALATNVYWDFLSSIEKAIDAQWGVSGLDAPEFNVVYELLLFRLLTDDANVARFYSEIMSGPEYHEASLDMQREVMHDLANGMGARIDRNGFYSIVCMVNGTEAELVKAVVDGKVNESIEDLVRRDIMCCYFLLGVDLDKASAHFERGLGLVENLKMVCDERFSCSIVPRRSC